MSQQLAQEEQVNTTFKSKLPWVVSGVLAVALVATIAINYVKADARQVVATVNGEKVTQGELYTNLKQQYGTDSLDQLINQKLVQQAADKKKVTISDKKMNAEIKKIKAQFADEAAFKDSLKQYNMTLADLKTQLRTQLQLEGLLADKIKVTDAEIATEFDKLKKEKVDAGQIKASHILVKTKAEAEKVLADLKAGADFAAKAKEVSTDGSATSGGDLGYFAAADMVKAFSDVAFKLKKDEISGVVQTEYGFHIIKVTDVPSQWTIAEKKAEIIESLRATKLNDGASAYIESLKAKAKIKKTLN
jgi:foldase protein PrsA